MYPSLMTVNSARKSYVFSEVEDGYQPEDNCPFELGQLSAEPPDRSKGKVARAILYMANEYKIDLDHAANAPGFKETLTLWNCMYPPSLDEEFRAKKIAFYQKTENTFISQWMCD
jgi:endonuclease I